MLESALELGLNSLSSVRVPACPDADPETVFVGARPRRTSIGIPLGVPTVLETLIPADPLTPFFESHRWFVAAPFGSGWTVPGGRVRRSQRQRRRRCPVAWRRGLTRQPKPRDELLVPGIRRLLKRKSLRIDDWRRTLQPGPRAQHKPALLGCEDDRDAVRFTARTPSVGSGVRFVLLLQRTVPLFFVTAAAGLARSTAGTAQAPVRKDHPHRHAGGG